MKSNWFSVACILFWLLTGCQQSRSPEAGAAADQKTPTVDASIQTGPTASPELPGFARAKPPPPPPAPAPPSPRRDSQLLSEQGRTNSSKAAVQCCSSGDVNGSNGGVHNKTGTIRKAAKQAGPDFNVRMPTGIDSQPSADFQKIKAELAADPVITVPGNPGDLRVWVGDQNAKANFPADMTQASADIVTSMRPATVKITPNAPAFKTTPESVCALFDPTGTTVHFELVPNIERAGKFRVGAGVWLFDSSDCSGTPNPKEAPDLEVEVVVKVVPDDMWKSVRDGISKFWAELIGLIVALLLFFARNLLKKLFGFDGK